MTAARRTAVILDVDGTLVDSVALHTVAWWEACRQAGYRVATRQLSRAIGMGSDKLLDHVLPNDRDRAVDAAVVSGHASLYAQYWNRLMPIDGARELIEVCAEEGWTVVLASSAKGTELAATRDALKADAFITAVTVSDDVPASKPAPDLVLQALTLAGAEPDQAVFVGDAIWDVEACRRAGVPCVGVATGAYAPEELHAAGAHEVYDSLRGLLEYRQSSLLVAGA